jgi:hypothetical protein
MNYSKLKLKEPCVQTRLFSPKNYVWFAGQLKIGHDVTEYVANCRAEQSKNNNYNDSNQNKNERVLNEALAFFLGSEQHDLSPPFIEIFLILTTNRVSVL